MTDWTPRHFDFNGSEMSLHIDEINVDAAYQMRADGTNPDVVEQYAEVMKQNDPDGWLTFPLIKLLRRQGADGNHRDLFLISGFHRLEAMKQNGYDEIQAVVSAGTHLDGIVLSAGENADRSQPRTNADIKALIEKFLTDPELNQWSNAQIARWCGVDAQTVRNHEFRLIQAGIELNRPEKLKFIDKHGNISYRTHKPPAKADAPPTDAPIIASVIDEEKEKRDTLQEKISDLQREIIALCIDGTPSEQDACRAQLFNKYPNYANVMCRDKLSVEDLDALHTLMMKIVSEARTERRAINDESYDLRKTLKDKFGNISWTDWEDAIGPHIESLYPLYAHYDDRWSKPIPRCNAILALIKELLEKVKAEGHESLLPEGFESTMGKPIGGSTLAQAVYEQRRATERMFRNLMTPKENNWKIDEYLEVFLKAYNRHEKPTTRLKANQITMDSGFTFGRQSEDALKHMDAAYKEVQAFLENRAPWFNDFVFDVCKGMCQIDFLIESDWDYKKFLDKEFKPDIPLSEPDMQAIADAGYVAMQEAYQEIKQRRSIPNFGVEGMEEDATEDFELIYKEELVGLREEIQDLLDDPLEDDIDTQASGLANVHEVPLDVVKAEIAQAKASRGVDVTVLTIEDEIKLSGLRSVLEGLHRAGRLAEQVGDGTRHANLYETTPDKVLALRDMILKASEC